MVLITMKVGLRGGRDCLVTKEVRPGLGLIVLGRWRECTCALLCSTPFTSPPTRWTNKVSNKDEIQIIFFLQDIGKYGMHKLYFIVSSSEKSLFKCLSSVFIYSWLGVTFPAAAPLSDLSYKFLDELRIIALNKFKFIKRKQNFSLQTYIWRTLVIVCNGVIILIFSNNCLFLSISYSNSKFFFTKHVTLLQINCIIMFAHRK